MVTYASLHPMTLIAQTSTHTSGPTPTPSVQGTPLPAGTPTRHPQLHARGGIFGSLTESGLLNLPSVPPNPSSSGKAVDMSNELGPNQRTTANNGIEAKPTLPSWTSWNVATSDSRVPNVGVARPGSRASPSPSSPALDRSGPWPVPNWGGLANAASTSTSTLNRATASASSE